MSETSAFKNVSDVHFPRSLLRGPDGAFAPVSEEVGSKVPFSRNHPHASSGV